MASIAAPSACRGRGSRRCGRSRSAAAVRRSRSPAAARSPSSNAARNEVVAAYDVMTGRELWTNAWPERFSQWMGGGEGPRATPTWADGLVYALGGQGRAALPRRGHRPGRLAHEHPAGCRREESEVGHGGLAAHRRRRGDRAARRTEGRSVAAYDRRTGKRLWTALDDKQAYVSPMQVTLLGVPQFLIVSAERLVGLSLDRRDVLWEFPWTTDHDASAAQPIVIGDQRVFYSSGYGARRGRRRTDEDRRPVRRPRGLAQHPHEEPPVELGPARRLHLRSRRGDPRVRRRRDGRRSSGRAGATGTASCSSPAITSSSSPRRASSSSSPPRPRSFGSSRACRRSRARPGTCRRLPTASCSSATPRRWRRSTCARDAK